MQLVDSYPVVLGTTFFIPAYAKQLFLAALLGFVVGIERRWRAKPASLRTFSLISTGSCLFTILSVEAAGGANAAPYDLTRIAAQIVTGIGFLGGGVIFKTANRVEGVTTGALIWLTAALGMACGFNKIGLVVWSFVIGMMIHFLSFLLYDTLFAYRARRSTQNRKRATTSKRPANEPGS